MQTIIVGKHLPVGPVERLLERAGTPRYICVDDLEAACWMIGDGMDQVILIIADDIDKSKLDLLPANVNFIVADAERLMSTEFAALFLGDRGSAEELADAA